MSEMNIDEAKRILREMGKLCPALDEAIGDDKLDVCRSSFKALRDQIGVTYWLVSDHEKRHFAKPFKSHE